MSCLVYNVYVKHYTVKKFNVKHYTVKKFNVKHYTVKKFNNSKEISKVDRVIQTKRELIQGRIQGCAPLKLEKI